MNSRYALVFIAAVLLLAGLVVPNILIGNTPIIRLNKAAEFTGIVSQTLGPDSKNHMPIAGKDFSLFNINSFENEQWFVGNVTTSTVSDKATVVIKISNHIPSVVLGPGTSFAHSSVQSFPTPVVNYLENQGIVYVSN